MVSVTLYDTKPYDRSHFDAAPRHEQVIRVYHEFRLTAETVSTAQKADAVCVFVNDRLDAPCLEELRRKGVRHVALRCAGFNNVDVAAAAKLQIAVTRVPAYSPNAVAEHAIGLLLTLNRKIHRAYNRVREHNFSLNGLVGFDIHGKKVGIVGTGKIGRITAEIFRGFGAEVIAHDPFPNLDWANQHQVRYETLEGLLNQCDIVSLHLPLSPQTTHLLNTRSLKLMKPGAYLINTSRGKLVDTTALIAALKQGRLGGVALDVYEEEEGIFFEDHSHEVLADDELNLLLTFPNVLVTSHQAFLTTEALREISRVTTENILRVASGLPALDGTSLT